MHKCVSNTKPILHITNIFKYVGSRLYHIIVMFMAIIDELKITRVLI